MPTLLFFTTKYTQRYFKQFSFYLIPVGKKQNLILDKDPDELR